MSTNGRRRCSRHYEGPRPRECGGKVAGRFKPVGREFLQPVSHRGVHVRRHGAPEHGERPHVFCHQFCDDRLCARAGVWRLAGEHLVRHRRERIDVRARVDHPVARRLLGAHVLRGAEAEARLRHPRAAGVAYCERNAKVRNDRLPRLQQDILRLHIAVNHTMLVRVVQRASHRGRDAHGFIHR